MQRLAAADINALFKTCSPPVGGNGTRPHREETGVQSRKFPRQHFLFSCLVVLLRAPRALISMEQMHQSNADREQHEQGLARFLVGEWRARFRESLAPAKRRDLLRSQLPHLTHLDPRFATPVDPAEQNARTIGTHLREKGAGDRCYVLSEDPDSTDLHLADSGPIWVSAKATELAKVWRPDPHSVRHAGRLVRHDSGKLLVA